MINLVYPHRAYYSVNRIVASRYVDKFKELLTTEPKERDRLDKEEISLRLGTYSLIVLEKGMVGSISFVEKPGTFRKMCRETIRSLGLWI